MNLNQSEQCVLTVKIVCGLALLKDYLLLTCSLLPARVDT